MKNFKVNFLDSERDAVVNILSRSNDIVINQIEPESAFITIQLEDEDADILYDALLTQIDGELRTNRPMDERLIDDQQNINTY